MSLQGTIETFAIGDVLRLLAATNKSGRLQVQGPDRSGTVWVDGGKVLAAESPNTPHADQVPDVLFQLVRFDRGSFSFELDRHPPQPGDPVDIEAALGEAESMVSEWREIERRVPSAQAWVALSSELPDDSVTVTAEQWKVVRAVAGGRSVAGIGDSLGLGELPALRAVDQLLGLGLVDVGAEPSAGDGDGTTSGSEGLATSLDDGGTGAGSGGGATFIGDAALVSSPGEGEARRHLDALAGAYGLPSSPTAEDSASTAPTAVPSSDEATPFGLVPPPPSPSPEASGERAGAGLVAEGESFSPAASAPPGQAETGAAATSTFPTDTHAGAAPHGDPLAAGGTGAASAAAAAAEGGRAAPPAPSGYDDGAGYGQATYSEYDQGAYSAYGEYGQQAQPGYGEYGQPPATGYGAPPPPPSPYGEYYGDAGRTEPPPPAPGAPLAPEWTSTGRSRESGEEGGSAASSGAGAQAGGSGTAGFPAEARARTVFESSAPPPPPPPPSGSTYGTGAQWFDGGPERLAPPPPPPPPGAGRDRGNGADAPGPGDDAGVTAGSGQTSAEDDASSLERQLRNLSPRAQDAIKRSSGLYEGRSQR